MMDNLNWFDLLVLVILLATLIKGYISGLVMQLALLAGLVLGAFFAGKLSEIIALFIISYIPSEAHVVGPLSYMLAFILILLGIFLVGKTVHASIKAMQLSPLNRLGGALFSSLKWMLLFSILLNLVVELDQDKSLIKSEVREQSYAYPYVTAISKLVAPYLKFDWFE